VAAAANRAGCLQERVSSELRQELNQGEDRRFSRGGHDAPTRLIALRLMRIESSSVDRQEKKARIFSTRAFAYKAEGKAFRLL